MPTTPAKEENDSVGSPGRKAGRPTCKRKMPRDHNAPKPPLNGYLRFLIERRMQKGPEFTEQHESTQEALSALAREWREMPTSERNRFLKSAEEDRAEYRKQMEAYKQTESYKQFQVKLKAWENSVAKNELSKSRDHSINNNNDAKFSDETFGSDMPIFTKEFLVHNKERESDLRRLRFEAIRLEEEQRALQSNVTRLKHACDDVQSEMDGQRAYNDILQRHMTAYRKTLAQTFAHLPLPGQSHGPSSDTIDEYMTRVQDIVERQPSDYQEFLAKIRDTTKRIKLPVIS